MIPQQTSFMFPPSPKSFSSLSLPDCPAVENRKTRAAFPGRPQVHAVRFPERGGFMISQNERPAAHVFFLLSAVFCYNGGKAR
jgi:hypothetical protein